MPIYKIFLALFFISWVTSCSTLPTELPSTKTQAPGSRVQTASDVQNWDLKALISIRNNAKPSNITANMQWQQNSKNYTILLFGPLGSGAAKLTGEPGQVKLETSDGKTYTANTLENLLAQQTDWTLPVSNLYFWIRGLPVPNVPAQKNFDNSHRLTELQQQGWHIHFLRYTSVNNIDMPNKIFLFNPELNVKIVISQWKI